LNTTDITDDQQEFLDLLNACGGYYERPNAQAPLVAYRGEDGRGRKYVGNVYVNFATVEEHGEALGEVAFALLERLVDAGHIQEGVGATNVGFCGAPEGGKALAAVLSSIACAKHIFPEKEVTALKTETAREKTRLFFDRHEPTPGMIYWIVEDVCNNFSTTKDMIALIESAGAKVGGVVCFFNRSMTVDKEFELRPGEFIPVVALVRMPIPQYEQDDPEVLLSVRDGNVEWKPKSKAGRARLMKAVEDAKQQTQVT